MTSTMAVIRNLGRLRLGGRHSGLIRLLPAAVTHGGPTSPSKRDYSSLLRPTPLTRDFLLPTPRRECSAPLARSLSLEAAQQSVQLFYFGCLKSVPVTFVMEQLCAFHDSTGLPWWAVVAMTTVTLRGLLVFPASVTSQKVLHLRRSNYRVNLVVVDLGWVDLYSGCSTVCPILPGQLGVLQLGKMAEHQNQSQPNPGPRPP